MKVTVNGISDKCGRKYPYLGYNRGTIIYFTSPEKGVCLQSGLPGDEEGEYCEVWGEKNCKPFGGSITLSNN